MGGGEGAAEPGVDVAVLRLPCSVWAPKPVFAPDDERAERERKSEKRCMRNSDTVVAIRHAGDLPSIPESVARRVVPRDELAIRLPSAMEGLAIQVLMGFEEIDLGRVGSLAWSTTRRSSRYASAYRGARPRRARR